MTWDDAWFAWVEAERLDPTMRFADFEDANGALEETQDGDGSCRSDLYDDGGPPAVRLPCVSSSASALESAGGDIPPQRTPSSPAVSSAAHVPPEPRPLRQEGGSQEQPGLGTPRNQAGQASGVVAL